MSHVMKAGFCPGLALAAALMAPTLSLAQGGPRFEVA